MALIQATFILTLAMRSQNALLRLDLDEKILACEKDVVDVFAAGNRIRTSDMPELLIPFIEEQVTAEGHGDASKYCGSLPIEAVDREQDERLEELLVDGLVSGADDIPVTREFRRALKVEAANRSGENVAGNSSR